MGDIVGNGQDAVDKADAVDNALIPMDIEMPVLDGIDATRATRAKPSLCHPDSVAGGPCSGTDLTAALVTAKRRFVCVVRQFPATDRRDDQGNLGGWRV